MNLLQKIPRWEKTIPVYAIIVVMIYTWSLLHFFWRLPSWLNFSTLGDVAILFFYMVVVNFIESVSILLAMILLCAALPSKWFLESFTTKASLLALLGLGSLMAFNQNLRDDLIFFTGMIVIVLALTFLLDRVEFVRKILEELANRMTVFLYIWMPISAIALLIVLVRNIFSP